MHSLVKRRVKQRSSVVSHGQFNHFGNCANLCNLNVTGEAVSADTTTAEEFVKLFGELRRVGSCQNKCSM